MSGLRSQVVLASVISFALVSSVAAQTPQQSCDRTTYYILQGQYARALKQLNGAPTPSTTPAQRENLRGLALMLSGDLQKAVAAFDTAIDLDSSLVEARFNRAITWMRLGMPARAVETLQAIAADEKNPLRATAAFNNALALDALGKSVEAEKWLEAAVQLDPSLDSSLLYLGALRERRGDLQAAGKAYKEFLAAHPDSVIAMLRFGVSAQRAGFAVVGKQYLKRVIEIAPDSAEATEARKFLVMWE
ncbi:MAG: tetratricopeptide repeat protein [Thermoanaerobaculia bacterium]